jgi:hypothetical protein
MKNEGWKNVDLLRGLIIFPQIEKISNIIVNWTKIIPYKRWNIPKNFILETDVFSF